MEMNILSCLTYEGRLEILDRLSLVAAHPAPLTLCVTLGVACILRALLPLLPAPGAALSRRHIAPRISQLR
jgi:hypothetical protein